jgi:hypothetical protein
MKPLNFFGSSLDDLRNFPEEARKAAGFELYAVPCGLERAIISQCPVSGAVLKKYGFTFSENGVSLRGQVRRFRLCSTFISKENAENKSA